MQHSNATRGGKLKASGLGLNQCPVSLTRGASGLNSKTCTARHMGVCSVSETRLRPNWRHTADEKPQILPSLPDTRVNCTSHKFYVLLSVATVCSGAREAPCLAAEWDVVFWVVFERGFVNY